MTLALILKTDSGEVEDTKEGSREFIWETDNLDELRRPRPMLGEMLRSGQVLDVSKAE